MHAIGVGRPARAGTPEVSLAAREELIHYEVLVFDAVGAKPATKRIWVPDSVFANAENFLTALVVGDQIFINAYLLGTGRFHDFDEVSRRTPDVEAVNTRQPA